MKSPGKLISICERHFSSIETPCFVILEDLMGMQVDAFRSAAARHLPEHSIFYSVKTNDCPPIVKWMAKSLGGVEVASEYEYFLAGELNVPSRNIIINGPAKGASEINRFLETGSMIVHVDSLSDLGRIERLAAEKGTKISTGIRLCPRHGSGAEKFGLDPAGGEFRDAIKLIGDSKHLNLVSLHYHGDYPISSLDSIDDLIGEMHDTWCDLKNNFDMKYLDIGGGWSPCIELNENGEWIENTLTTKLFSRLGNYFECQKRDAPILILEPGRSVIEGGVLAATRVVGVKRDRDVTWVYVDIGTGFVGGSHVCDRRMKVIRTDAEGSRSGDIRKVSICGPLCYGSDVLATFDTDRTFKEGDILFLGNVGAYTMTLRWHGSVPYPAVYWIDVDSKLRVIRKRQGVDASMEFWK